MAVFFLWVATAEAEITVSYNGWVLSITGDAAPHTLFVSEGSSGITVDAASEAISSDGSCISEASGVVSCAVSPLSASVDFTGDHDDTVVVGQLASSTQP